jgi:hypothetical protein
VVRPRDETYSNAGNPRGFPLKIITKETMPPVCDSAALLCAASKCIQGVTMCSDGLDLVACYSMGSESSMYAEDGGKGGQEV